VASRRIAAIFALFGLAVGLTGCGVSSTLDPVAEAASKTQDAGGVKMTMAIDVADETSGKTFSISANGAFDREQGKLTMDMTGALESAGAPAGVGGSLELLYLQEGGSTVMYMDFPLVSNLLGGGKRWIRLDLDKAGKALGVDLGQTMGQAGQNPAQILDMLRASGQVEQVGTETIAGVETTKYKGAIDLAKAAEQHGVSSDMVEKLMAAGAPTHVPVEVWVGDDGLVRQFRLTEELATGGHSGSVRITVGLSDYGTDVSVTAPPAAEVFDATALAALAGQQAATPPGP
jgi:hypothetical protein